MAEIVPVVSEALEAQIRDLLPSQRGFGEDLQASNVITPIIDLTAAAEGTTTPQYLQEALAFGSNTAFAINNTTTVIANTAGFYRIVGTSNITTSGSVEPTNTLQMSDGLTTKNVWKHLTPQGTAGQYSSIEFDLVVFLRAGDSISGISNYTGADLVGSSRQVATVNGVLVNPVGFTPQ